MMCTVILLASLFQPDLSQILSREEAGSFVRALLLQDESLKSWFDTNDLAISRRLGIEYKGVVYKNLISYDVDDSVRQMVKDNRLRFSFQTDSLDRDYARVVLTFDGILGTKEYYFKGKHCVSPLRYLAKDWTVIESTHFRFFIGDSNLFNSYCIEQLESFLGRMATLIGLRDSDMKKLREEKIYYYHCRNEDDIRRLTGFPARGMYNLAYDAVISTFNTHFHELLHLLMNYKLRSLPLYTHPFLQEGFAVAYGGRGGIEASVLHSVGVFLYSSQFIELTSFLNKGDFEQVDASLSYPAAGLFNRFLVESIGMDPYLQLYRRHSGPARADPTTRISPDELPGEDRWKSYLEAQVEYNAVSIDSPTTKATIIFEDGSCTISEDNRRYYFQLSEVLVLPGTRTFPNYVSKTFRETLPDEIYQSEKFLIRVTSEGISTYNLFTNNLIASYAASFSLPPKQVPRQDGRYYFSLRKEVFDESLSSTLTKLRRDTK